VAERKIQGDWKHDAERDVWGLAIDCEYQARVFESRPSEGGFQLFELDDCGYEIAICDNEKPTHDECKIIAEYAIELRARAYLRAIGLTDDLEALIASVATADKTSSVVFSTHRNGERNAAIRDYLGGHRDDDYEVAFGEAPTFAAALRAAIEQLGEGNRGA